MKTIQLIPSIPAIENKYYRIMSADGHGGCLIRNDLDDAISAAFNPTLGNRVAIFAQDGSPVQAYQRDSMGTWLPTPCFAPAPVSGATTRLERHVQKWINERAKEYDDGPRGVLKDLFYGGCESGMVNHLIYYNDTAKFFATHRREISAMLIAAIDEAGDNAASPKDIFGSKWDAADPLAQETANRNLLAWFGFEETARALAERNGIEL